MTELNLDSPLNYIILPTVCPNYLLNIIFPSLRVSSNEEGTLSVQISSVDQSCLTFCNPMDCSTPGFTVHHQLPALAQTHVHRVSDAIQPSHPLLPLLLLPSIFPSTRVFSNESVLPIRCQSIRASASVSVLAMNVQD